MNELDNRRAHTTERVGAIKAELGEAESLARGKACVYATGSFGREEASSHSDLDLFIVGKSKSKDDGGSSLSRLDEICTRLLIGVTRKLGIKEFSSEGRYLTHRLADQKTMSSTP